jgi:predicted signal transduction protein with EAL and GGDEF domain
MRRISIWFACFRFIAYPALLVTLILAGFLFKSADPNFLTVAIWIKLVTTGLLLLFVHLFHSAEFFFFNNLGYSDRAIYARMIMIDFLISASLFYFILKVI